MVVFLAKLVVFGESSCFRVKGVFIGQKWLYSAKYLYIRANVVVMGEKCVYSGKVTVFV